MSSRTRFEFGFGATRQDQGAARKSRGDFRVLVLGDLSGRSTQPADPGQGLSGRRARTLDVDNFDAVLGRIAPTLVLGDICGVGRLDLRFESLEDFHPDRLCASIEACRELQASRSRLTSPATFGEEARRLTASPHPVSGNVGAVTGEDREALLQRIIGAQRRDGRAEAAATGVVDRLIRQLVGTSGSSKTEPSPEPYLAAIDATLSEHVREVLHHPAFQSLEGTWRGLRRFVDSVDTGESLTLQVLDLGKKALFEDLVGSGNELRDSATFHTISGATQDGVEARPSTLLVGLYRFGATEPDVSLLERLAALAAQLRSPMIVDAEATLAGCRSLHEDSDPRNWALPDDALEARWGRLRRSSSARWLGLALPRVLARLPFGARTEPVESFNFEEISGEAAHEDLLWGSAALACAQAMAVQVLDGVEFVRCSGPMEIDDLPVYTRRVDGETILQPCAEYLLPARMGEELSRRGMIPLLSYANRNAVRIMGVQSFADPWSALGDPAVSAPGADGS